MRRPHWSTVTVDCQSLHVLCFVKSQGAIQDRSRSYQPYIRYLSRCWRRVVTELWSFRSSSKSNQSGPLNEILRRHLLNFAFNAGRCERSTDKGTNERGRAETFSNGILD